ncbi:ComEC/Rec2 family competence protein [Sphingomonas sp. BN140010]|uniref:ComEC/Rec2 family competence protein n=1 Tax=Sphingomonas arvum TaxID=2992113 RepID=A0ABT3JEJ6_9SPHN|nr:ComEC/Rec2 family competence protein [Sphingomonas sp. BN140010]MCW3797344.1 ComEC/Rec2 family competence protein [Sphingomonas sp. BN140010]
MRAQVATMFRRRPAVAKWPLRALFASAESFLEREREALPLWWVVAFGVGVALWLVLPGPDSWRAVLLVSAGTAVASRLLHGRVAHVLLSASLAVALGLGLVWLRSGMVEAPRIARPAITTFDATVMAVDPLVARNSIRLLVRPADPSLPPLLRINVREQDAPTRGLGPGARVRVKTRLAPPMPMPLPGAHDYARDAWFAGIGGTGKALGAVELLEPATGGGLDALRDRLDRHIRSQLGASEGGIATALVTGDQGALPDADANAMRRSGLAHLLSVSGLHIAAAIGAAFLLTLRLLALSERLALRVNLVLAASGAGALAGVGYTLLTGMQVPTVRSCIAAVLVLIGIALGREAISMRLIAAAALAVLLVRPEALYGASFQLSFAAVTTLVALYSWPWFKRVSEPREDGMVGRVGRNLTTMVVTGLAIEVALLPFALYHFHKAGLYGVAANLVAIPLTTFAIMPLEAAALLLDLLGLGGPMWAATGWSVGLLLKLAHAAASAPGSVALLPAMPAWAFGAMVGGGLWLCLWSGRFRLAGFAPILLGAAAAALAPRPDLLVTGDGRHLAIIGEDGTPYVLRERAGDFVRDMLGESAGFDGELPALDDAPGSNCSRDSCVASVERGGRTWRLLAIRSSQRLDWAELTAACSVADIVVADRRLPRACQPRALKLDGPALARLGGVAIRLDDEPIVDSVAGRIAGHPWAIRPR